MNRRWEWVILPLDHWLFLRISEILTKKPHLTSTVHCLLSDCLLRWMEPIFRGFLRTWEKPFSYVLAWVACGSYCHRALCGTKLIRKTMISENQIPHVKLMSTNITWKPVRKPFPKKHYPLSHARFPSSLSITWTKTTDRDTGVNNQQPQFVGLFYPETFSKSLAFK